MFPLNAYTDIHFCNSLMATLLKFMLYTAFMNNVFLLYRHWTQYNYATSTHFKPQWLYLMK